MSSVIRISTLNKMVKNKEVKEQDIETVENFLRQHPLSGEVEKVIQLIGTLSNKQAQDHFLEMLSLVQKGQPHAMLALEALNKFFAENNEGTALIKEITEKLLNISRRNADQDKLIDIVFTAFENGTKNHLKIALLLLKAYPALREYVTDTGFSLYVYAVLAMNEYQNPRIWDTIIEAGVKDIPNSAGCTALVFLLDKSKSPGDVFEKAAKYLIAKKVGINDQSLVGATPLHVAVWNGKLDIAQQLIEQGASLFIQDNDRCGRIAAIVYGDKGQTPVEMLHVQKRNFESKTDRYSLQSLENVKALLAFIEKEQPKQAFAILHRWADTQIKAMPNAAQFGQDRLALLRTLKEQSAREISAVSAEARVAYIKEIEITMAALGGNSELSPEAALAMNYLTLSAPSTSVQLAAVSALGH